MARPPRKRAPGKPSGTSRRKPRRKSPSPPATPPPPAEGDEVSRLCLSCGLCCNGALFARVKVTAEEVTRLEGRVELREDSDGDTVLAQPCRALERRRCTVYLDRPEACRAYVCLLVQRFTRGEVDFRTALDVVREARLTVGNVARVLGPPRPGDPLNTMTRAGVVWKDEARKAALGEQARDALVRARQRLLLAFGV